jgi:glycosyltransferase involved in cell wall biosynthesis
MKKIVFCIYSLNVGGAEKLLLDLVKGLFETNNYEITVLVFQETESFIEKNIKKYCDFKTMISKDDLQKKLYFNSLKNIYLSLAKKKNFNKVMEDKDIVIDFLSGDFHKYIKPLKKIKKIIWLHSEYEYLKTNKVDIEKKIIDYDKIITVCDEILYQIEEKQSYLKEKLKRVYAFFDLDRISKKLEEENIFENKKILEEKYFVTVCRLKEADKDVATIIKAFENYKGEEKLYIVGDGEDRKNLEELSKKMVNKDKIIFLGMQENPYIIMKHSSAFILSSKSEGFGMVLVEALFSGTKVISSNHKAGVNEILEDGTLGKIFEVGNKEELLELMNGISEFKVDRDKVLESLKKYELNAIIAEIEEIFNEKNSRNI